jgi:hypothetical protein
VGENECTSSTQCTADQEDLCKGQCTNGGGECTTNGACTVPQLDVCRGTCAVSEIQCLNSSVCVGGASELLKWKAPTSFGATSVQYDTLRSTVGSNFASAFCAETDGTDTKTVDSQIPTAGVVYYYLIRVENSCPGGSGSNMGTSSAGVPRTGVLCQ